MTEQQKKAAAALSLALIAGATLFLVWLLAAILLSSGSLGNRPPGRQFMLLIANWSVLGVALKALPPLITWGLGIFAGYKVKDWQFYWTVGTSSLGLVASTYLLLEVSSIDTARRFWAYAPGNRLEDYDSFVTAAQTGLGVFAAWFVGVVGIQLSMKQGNG